jgi:hypothetical protein
MRRIPNVLRASHESPKVARAIVDELEPLDYAD